MENSVARTLKVTSFIAGGIGFIGGIVGGFLFTASSYSSFNWGIMIGMWFSVFIACLLLYAIGEIIELLSEANVQRDELLAHCNKEDSAPAQIKPSSTSPTYRAPASTAPALSRTEWRCNTCDTKNAASAMSCKGCGTLYSTDTSTPVRPPAAKPASLNSSDNVWTCKKCGTKTPVSSMTCSGCGEWK